MNKTRNQALLPCSGSVNGWLAAEPGTPGGIPESASSGSLSPRETEHEVTVVFVEDDFLVRVFNPRIRWHLVISKRTMSEETRPERLSRQQIFI